MKVLVVEDQPKMLAFLKQGLSENGYLVEAAETGQGAELLVSENEFDIIVLDIMLPDQTGLATSENLRRDGYTGPILMLTALSSIKNKVKGLDAGADDYLTKPFAFEELLARMRALLRRKESIANNVLEYDQIKLDLVRGEVERKQKIISLTAKERSLLEYFLRNSERPITRTEILEHVWEVEFEVGSNVVDVYVNMLRKKIDQPFPYPLLQTVVGVGYVLKVPEK